MTSKKFVIEDSGELEPLLVTIAKAMQLTGESRSQIYVRIGRGEYDAVKSDSRTLITYESIKRRIATLTRAKIKPPQPRPRRMPRQPPDKLRKKRG
jgi:hypothetical protein